VLLPEDDSLLGKCIKVKITETFKWHITGNIIEREPKMPEVKDYFGIQKNIKAKNEGNISNIETTASDNSNK